MKLKLRIEDLTVASFEAAPALQERGTVQGAQVRSDLNTCYPIRCHSAAESCLGTCFEETCGLSCDPTCMPEYCTAG